MNKINYVIPLVLTLIFTGFYYVHTGETKKHQIELQAKADKAAQEEAAKKAEAERQAKADSDRRTAERIAEEARKEEEKRVKWQAAGDAIIAETNTYIKQAEKNADELKSLTAKLAQLRSQKETATQANLDFELKIEQARIIKRATDMEIQRLVEMIARKGGTSLAADTSPAK